METHGNCNVVIAQHTTTMTTMTTTYTWHIANLERKTADGFVFTAHYTVDATDGRYPADGAYGSIGFKRPDNLIPFADLTEGLVISWVKEALGGPDKVAEIEAALQAQLDEQHQPTKAIGVPWQ
jgi:hypothetical protein